MDGREITPAQRIADGDRSAEDDFVRAFQRGVLAIVASRLRDREAARDIAQEVMMAAVTALREGRVREPENPAAFLHGIARNLTNRYLRTKLQQNERQLAPDFDVARPAADPGVADRMELVRKSLNGLRFADQRILLMTLVDGFKPAEIAAQLGMSRDAVRQRKSRALKTIIESVRKLAQTGRGMARTM